MVMRTCCTILIASLLAACGGDPRATTETPAAEAATDIPADAPELLPPPEMADPAPDEPVVDAPVVDEPATVDGDEPPPANTIAVGEPNPGAPDVVDTSCRTDSDCAIKDVGSCCGYRPACVNTASPTFPEQVQAACAKDGRMGICGFPAITGCTCNAGKCEGTGSDAGEQVH